MGAFLGAQELQNIFVISQFLTIISHWRKVEGVVALVGREQGICKFGSDVYNFLVAFFVAILVDKFARKDGWEGGCGWAEEEEESSLGSSD